MTRTRAADGVTAARLAVAPALAVCVAAGALGAAAVLLAMAWLADALDGALARGAARPTRLGRYDLAVDAAVGAGALLGPILAGTVPRAPATMALVVLGGGFLVLRNPALGLALQATGYVALLWTVWAAGVATVWLPLATSAALLVLGYRRLVAVVIPGFLHGLAELARLRGRRSFELRDEE